jgi:hypothetical protein
MDMLKVNPDIRASPMAVVSSSASGTRGSFIDRMAFIRLGDAHSGHRDLLE